MKKKGTRGGILPVVGQGFIDVNTFGVGECLRIQASFVSEDRQRKD